MWSCTGCGRKVAETPLSRPPKAWLLVATLVATLAAPARAQIVVTVRDGRSGNPVPSALVRTLDSNGNLLASATTELQGQAVFPETEGVISVSVEALGYVSTTVRLTDRNLEVRLETDALKLDSIVVEADPADFLPGRMQFAQRRAGGEGLFLDPMDVGLKSKYGVLEIFRGLDELGVRRRMLGRFKKIESTLGNGCFEYRLDNLRVREPDWQRPPLSSLLPKDIVAVEIYRYFGEVPENLRHLAGREQLCGLVIIWTRVGW